MTFTLAVSDVLLLILTLAVCIVAYSLVRTLREIHHLADQLGKNLAALHTLTGRIQHLSDETELTAISLRRFSDVGAVVAGDLAVATSTVREVVQEGAGYVHLLFRPLRYLPLVAAGLKAGYSAYSRFRERETETDS